MMRRYPDANGEQIGYLREKINEECTLDNHRRGVGQH